MNREVRQDGFTVRLDLSHQVLALDAPSDKHWDTEYVEPDLAPAPFSYPGIVSASVLSQKAKLFDDALYAAVDLAAQRGQGSFPSKLGFFRDWAVAALRAAEHGEATRVPWSENNRATMLPELRPKRRQSVQSIVAKGENRHAEEWSATARSNEA